MIGFQKKMAPKRKRFSRTVPFAAINVGLI
jgi:hypothetical protein